MKSIIIDDEISGMQVLKDYANNIPYVELSGTYIDALKGLEYLQNNHVDLLFLDINMPDLSGIQLLNSLPNPPMVIFTTAYPEYALKSYDFNAIDYLLKPVEYDRFLRAVNKAYRLWKADSSTMKATPEKILFRDGKKMYNVDSEDILYIKGANNYVSIHLVSLVLTIRSTIKEVLSKLPSNSFMQVHRSYIVSLRHLEAIDSQSIRINGFDIPIGKYYKKSISDFASLNNIY